MANDPADLAIMREFGEFLCAVRNARKLTQEQLAELADLDRTTVGKIERGKVNPRLATINRLAVALDEHYAGFFPCRPRP